MTVSYVIIIVIIWQKSSISIKDGTSNDKPEKSRFRRLLSAKRSGCNGRKRKSVFFLSRTFHEEFLDDHQIESSIRNARSLGVIPRAKIKTVKMTLVIVIG
jgi:hypothetical protein